MVPPPPRYLVLRAPPQLRAALDALALRRGTSRHRAALDALGAGAEQLAPAPERPSPLDGAA